MSGMTVTLLGLALLMGQPSPTLQDVMAALASPDWETRADGTRRLGEALEADPALLESDEIADRVAAMLHTEAVAFDQREQSGSGYVGFRETYYIDVLSPVAVRLLQRSGALSPAFVSGALRIPHNSFSEFTRLVARQGAPIQIPAIAMLAAESLIDRNAGYSLIGEALRAHALQQSKTPFTAEQRNALLASLRGGLLDGKPSCRVTAIQALVLARDKESIPMITHLMNTDPDDGAGFSPAYPSVRKVAADAIQRLSR